MRAVTGSPLTPTLSHGGEREKEAALPTFPWSLAKVGTREGVIGIDGNRSRGVPTNYGAQTLKSWNSGELRWSREKSPTTLISP